MFLDESGFMLPPVRRRTWAPRGQTPTQNAWDRHERFSVIAAITRAPQRMRHGLYFRLCPHNIDTAELVDFLITLHRQLRRPLLRVMDRWNVHRAAMRHLEERYGDRFVIEWLPAYAPELNPVEQVWNHTKYGDLANFVPDAADDLHEAIETSLSKKRQRRPLLEAAFRFAKLE